MILTLIFIEVFFINFLPVSIGCTQVIRGGRKAEVACVGKISSLESLALTIFPQ